MGKPNWRAWTGGWLASACVAAITVASADARTQAPVLTGRVETKDGKPAAKWQVVAVGRTAPQSIRLGKVLRHETVTDAGGSFVLQVAPGIGYDVWAVEPGDHPLVTEVVSTGRSGPATDAASEGTGGTDQDPRFRTRAVRGLGADGSGCARADDLRSGHSQTNRQRGLAATRASRVARPRPRIRSVRAGVRGTQRVGRRRPGRVSGSAPGLTEGSSSRTGWPAGCRRADRVSDRVDPVARRSNRRDAKSDSVVANGRNLER